MISMVLGLGITQLLGGMRQHYENSSRLFFGAFTIVIAWALFLEPVLGVRRLLVGFRLLQVLALVATGSCVFSRSRLVHRLAAMTILTLWVVHLVLIRFRAGEFDFHG